MRTKLTEQQIYEVICSVRDYYLTEKPLDYGFCFILIIRHNLFYSREKKPYLDFIRKYGNFHKRIFFRSSDDNDAKTKDNTQFWFPQRAIQPRIDLLNKAISNYLNSLTQPEP